MTSFEFIPSDNWTEIPGIRNEDEKPMNSSVIQLVNEFHEVPNGCLIVGILLHLLGIVEQFFIVIYERNEMDPMKRSLTNQVHLSFEISSLFKSDFLLFSTDDINTHDVGLMPFHLHHPALSPLPDD